MALSFGVVKREPGAVSSAFSTAQVWVYCLYPAICSHVTGSAAELCLVLYISSRTGHLDGMDGCGFIWIHTDFSFSPNSFYYMTVLAWILMFWKMSLPELKGTLVLGAPCSCGSTEGSRGGCDMKGVDHQSFVSWVARAAVPSERRNCRWLWAVFHALLQVMDCSCAAAALELSLHPPGTPGSCGIPGCGCNFCCFSGSSAGNILPWSC